MRTNTIYAVIEQEGTEAAFVFNSWEELFSFTFSPARTVVCALTLPAFASDITRLRLYPCRLKVSNRNLSCVIILITSKTNYTPLFSSEK